MDRLIELIREDLVKKTKDPLKRFAPDTLSEAGVLHSLLINRALMKMNKGRV